METLKSDCYNVSCMLAPSLQPGWAGNKHDLGYFDTQYGIGEDGKKSASRSHFLKQKNGASLYVKSDHSAQGWDNKIMPVTFWNLAKAATENQLIFGVNYIAQNIPFVSIDWGYKPPRRTEYNDFIRNNPTGFIIWDKCNGSNDFADCELIWTSFNEPTFIKHFMWNGMMQTIDPENGTKLNSDKRKNQKRIHPTEKPILLNRWLLKKHLLPGMSVIDTHSGSQSCRIAAWHEGINYEGYETDKKYFDAGHRRFKFHEQSKKLFH